LSTDAAKAAWLKALDTVDVNGHNGNAQSNTDRVVNFVNSAAQNSRSRWNQLMTNDHAVDKNLRREGIRSDIRTGATQLVGGGVWDKTTAQQRAIDFVTKTAEVTAARMAIYDRSSQLDSEKQAALQDAAAELRRKLPF
jgi:hypothetical protein